MIDPNLASGRTINPAAAVARRGRRDTSARIELDGIQSRERIRRQLGLEVRAVGEGRTGGADCTANIRALGQLL